MIYDLFAMTLRLHDVKAPIKLCYEKSAFALFRPFAVSDGGISLCSARERSVVKLVEHGQELCAIDSAISVSVKIVENAHIIASLDIGDHSPEAGGSGRRRRRR